MIGDINFWFFEISFKIFKKKNLISKTEEKVVS